MVRSTSGNIVVKNVLVANCLLPAGVVRSTIVTGTCSDEETPTTNVNIAGLAVLSYRK